MGTHPIFESDFDCLTDMRSEPNHQNGASQRVIAASAPGKVILSGEHSVVYNRRAIATTLSLRLTVRLERCQTNTIALISQSFSVSISIELYNRWKLEFSQLSNDELISRIREKVNHEFDGYGRGAILAITALVYSCLQVYTEDIPSLSITVTSQLQSGGLGSSAAFSVALSAALLTDSGLITLGQDQNDFNSENKNTINNLARKCEEIFHGRCSGIDNTIVTYGGAIEWSGGEFSQLDVTNPPRVLIVDTHVERSTSKLVESVRLRRERQMQVVENIFNAIDSVVEKLISLLNNSDLIHSYNNQKELFEMNQHLLSSLGVSHASLDVIISAASEVGLAGKLTGAGGGGCAFVLLPPSGMTTMNDREDNEAQIAVLKQLLNQKGFTSIETNLAENGIKLEYVHNTQR